MIQAAATDLRPATNGPPTEFWSKCPLIGKFGSK